VYAGIVAVLGLTGITACMVPARRATRIEPSIALRSE
jgi:ABC-type antimicrobial peptide transport system permease subunit